MSVITMYFHCIQYYHHGLPPFFETTNFFIFYFFCRLEGLSGAIASTRTDPRSPFTSSLTGTTV
jgi:hypothetical protein